MKIRLLLVDDHAVVRVGLRLMLQSEADIEILGSPQISGGNEQEIGYV